MDEAPSFISLIPFLLLMLAIFAGFAFGVAYVMFGIVPIAIVNGLLALTGKQRRIPIWALPYMGWGGSIAAVTLLSIVANFQTNLKYNGSIGSWIAVTLVELALTAVGIGLAWRGFAKQRNRVYAASQVDYNAIAASSMSIMAHIYWIVWFLGIFILNWIIDMTYILGIGVDIQGIGPGWIDLLD